MPRSVSDGPLPHRPDVDGLRAIAVIPVLLYHARLGSATGGFVGVDVFFVISGYLITGLILQDIQAGRFSLPAFYERRIRRILPALLGILVCSAVAVHFLFLPDDTRTFANSLLATLVYSSNVLFWKEAGYFDQPSETKPLLHTWSLAVEEQFYILYPLFLVGISRYFRRRYGVAISIVLLASLALSITGVSSAPTATFFLAPGRIWELLVGALLALNAIPGIQRPLPAALLGLTGLAAIGYSVLGFSAGTPFPGANALFPVLGAALVIHSGTGTRSAVTRLLSAPPLVFVGLISYSLYLWHWVLLVFLRYYLIRPLTRLEAGQTLIAAFIVAILSWRFIERPFRGRHGIGSRRLVFSALGVSSLALAAYGGAVLATGGFPGRFTPRVHRALAGTSDLWKRYAECTDKICDVGPDASTASFILWGDSHAGAIAPAVELAAWSTGVSGVIANHNACAPLLHLERYDPLRRPCSGYNDSVLALIDVRHIRTVLLHARWALYTEGYRTPPEPGPPVLLSSSRRVEDNPAEFERLFRGTLAELRRRRLRVVIIASVPEIGPSVPRAMALQARSGSRIDLEPRFENFAARQVRAFGVLQRAARDYSASIVYPHEALCDSAVCMIARYGYPLYRDGDHLSVRGAEYLTPMFERVLKSGQ
jgi:peptidoglycan/LPS O-acetylase OafA/YrhL